MRFNFTFALFCLILFSCTSQPQEESVAETFEVEDVSPQETVEPESKPMDTESQIQFIREKFTIITEAMAAEAYAKTNFVKEDEAGELIYERQLEGDALRFVSINNGYGHGYDKISYYFWEDQLIFKFEEGYYWVGNTDKFSEVRTYYANNTAIRVLQKEAKAQGQEAVRKKLSGMAHNELAVEGAVDQAFVDEVASLTEESIEAFLVKQYKD